MSTSTAASITKTASKQTYYTIRFLVDRDRMEDAYRAYGYFRWVDDVIDADKSSETQRMAFLDRQKSLLESCYRGEPAQDLRAEERMLVELVQHDTEKNSSLQSYLRYMMRVMDFDSSRRGKVVSEGDLKNYTNWLAVSVTECIHYFIGHDDPAPQDESRYLAVSAAHIAHMLRDTYDDILSGYFNIPLEILDANDIGPFDVTSDPYRSWVKSRVLLARQYFKMGKRYLTRVRSTRYRLAVLAYSARFEWLLDTIEREDFHLRPQYKERKRLGAGLRMSWLALASMINMQGAGTLSQPVASQRPGKP